MPRKPKATRAAEAAVLDAAPTPARRGRPPRAKLAPMPTETDSPPDISARDGDAATEPNDFALMPEPVDAGEAAAEAKPAEPTPAPSPAKAAPSKSAAQWDPAADTVQFDWAEIERTASRPGPNQVMAKLLVAARAEGSNSRWPFGAA